MQHFLASRLTRDVSAKHLYIEYKHWIETEKPFKSIEEELQTLDRQGKHFRRLTTPRVADPLCDLATFLQVFDNSTVYPLMLFLMDQGLSEPDMLAVGILIESYLLRRAMCGLTSKNYNRLFLALTKTLQSTSELTSPLVVDYLSALGGESSEWPSDNKFREVWRTAHVYQTLGPARTTYILRRLSDTFLTSKNE